LINPFAPVGRVVIGVLAEIGRFAAFVGRAVGKIHQSAPHLRKLQRRGATESPQAALLRRHGVRPRAIPAVLRHRVAALRFRGAPAWR